MIKNFFSVILFLFTSFFILFVISTYVSEKNQKKINLNRQNVHLKIKESLINLPFLKNDTQDVIEFNSGYRNENNKKKRNFWNLFKKND